MKILTVTPLYFERDNNGKHLVSRVDFYGYDRRKRAKLWWSAFDITATQLCQDVAAKFHAEQVHFQPPLFDIETSELHAGDYF